MKKNRLLLFFILLQIFSWEYSSQIHDKTYSKLHKKKKRKKKRALFSKVKSILFCNKIVYILSWYSGYSEIDWQKLVGCGCWKCEQGRKSILWENQYGWIGKAIKRTCSQRELSGRFPRGSNVGVFVQFVWYYIPWLG